MNFYANPYGDHCGFYFDTADELKEGLKTADFEEYSIDCIDYEYSDIFHALNIDSSNLEEFLDFMDNLQDYEVIAVKYLSEYCGYSFEDIVMAYSDVIVFKGTLKECAQDFMPECFDIPDNLINYIDYDAFARDMTCAGDWFELDGYVICNANDI